MQSIQTGTDASWMSTEPTLTRVLQSDGCVEADSTSVAGVISFVNAESLPPEVRRFNCHIFVPLLLTCAAHLGRGQSWEAFIPPRSGC